MPSNPFVIGQWVRAGRFYGRASHIEEIIEGPRNWIWILGTRRIGKTSLLKQIEHLATEAEPRRYVPVFWDFQGADDPEELHRTFREAVLDAGDRLEALGIAEGDVQGSDLFDALGRLRRKVRARSLQLLLLCDEVEELIKINQKDPSLLRKLRRSMQSQEDVRSVLASTIRLWALAGERGDTSPFLHGFTPPLYIRGLAPEEARGLIRQANLAGESRPRFDDAAVEEIRSRCDNHPYLIQLVCKRYLEVERLDDAIEQVAADQMVSHFFAVDFEMLSREERDVIRIIAETSAASSDSILARIASDPGTLSGVLLRLDQLGYVRRNSEGRFELVNHFFRRWLQAQPPALTPPAEPHRAAADPPSAGGSTLTVDVRPTVLDGRYVLLQEIGRGAMGVVYKCRDEVLGEVIALKVLKPEYGALPEALERFRREILLARDLGHPNILKIYHFGDWQGQKYLAMKLIEGTTLARVIAKEGALPFDRTVRIGAKLASALEAAHAHRAVHRDIKPSNVLMDRRGEPYLSDFGLARLLDSPGLTRSGIFLGTPAYASPEQAMMLPATERSDIYSLGLVLFEMATGRMPFVAHNSEQILELHRSSPPPDPRLFRPSIPPGLAEAILRCLRKPTDERYQNAGELRTALERVTA